MSSSIEVSPQADQVFEHRKRWWTRLFAPLLKSVIATYVGLGIHFFWVIGFVPEYWKHLPFWTERLTVDPFLGTFFLQLLSLIRLSWFLVIPLLVILWRGERRFIRAGEETTRKTIVRLLISLCGIAAGLNYVGALLLGWSNVNSSPDWSETAGMLLYYACLPLLTGAITFWMLGVRLHNLNTSSQDKMDKSPDSQAGTLPKDGRTGYFPTSLVSTGIGLIIGGYLSLLPTVICIGVYGVTSTAWWMFVPFILLSLALGYTLFETGIWLRRPSGDSLLLTQTITSHLLFFLPPLMMIIARLHANSQVILLHLFFIIFLVIANISVRLQRVENQFLSSWLGKESLLGKANSLLNRDHGSAVLLPFYIAGGTLPGDAPSYVERRADRLLYNALLQGDFCYILTARQMGKSSLMVRTAAALQSQGFDTITLDLSAIGRNLSPEQWYVALLAEVGRALGIRKEMLAYWKANLALGPVQRFFAALQEVVFPSLPATAQLAIFIDEIDVVRSLSFSADEFFAAIRESYNRRAQEPEWKRLRFCLLGIATPADLIRDARITPFNIGYRIELTDFAFAEAKPLVAMLGKRGESLLERVFYWTGGHPYLTQRLCQLLAALPTEYQKREAVDRLTNDLFFAPNSRDQDDNLSYVQRWLLQGAAVPEEQTVVLERYADVRSGMRVEDNESDPGIALLLLSGAVRAEAGVLRVRNRIYERVFDGQWAIDSHPGKTIQRVQRAYARGARTAILTLVLPATVLTATGIYWRWNMDSVPVSELRQIETRIAAYQKTHPRKKYPAATSQDLLLAAGQLLVTPEGKPIPDSAIQLEPGHEKEYVAPNLASLDLLNRSLNYPEQPPDIQTCRDYVSYRQQINHRALRERLLSDVMEQYIKTEPRGTSRRQELALNAIQIGLRLEIATNVAQQYSEYHRNLMEVGRGALKEDLVALQRSNDKNAPSSPMTVDNCRLLGRKLLQIAPDPERTLTEILLRERYLSDISMRDLFLYKNWYQRWQEAFPTEYSLILQARVLQIVKPADLLHEIDQHYDEQLFNASLNYQAAMEQSIDHRPQSPMIEVYPLPFIDQRNFHTDSIRFANTYHVAKTHLLALGFALEAYRMDHRKYPPALMSLVPHYLPAIPIDPFAPGKGGKLPILIYKHTANGKKYVVYSVGPDGVNDNKATGENPLYFRTNPDQTILIPLDPGYEPGENQYGDIFL